ncbi:MAG: MBL fold metallo-hydrolase [Oscillospiraceae bacterium]
MAQNHYTVHPINKNTFALEEKNKGAQGLCYLLIGDEKALLIDTCFGLTGFLPAVKSLTNLPIIVANTHVHVDHIGGNHFFDEIWFHQADKDIFTLHINPEYTLNLLAEGLPAPLRALMGAATKSERSISSAGSYHYFGDEHVFHLGGRDIEVIPTPGHTPGSVCFLDSEARMLFSGDTVCEWGILLHFKGEGCPPEVFLQSMQRLKKEEHRFDTIWPGHHGFPVEKSYIDDYLTCAQQIVEGTVTYSKTKGRTCAKYNRVLITVQQKEI